MVSTEESVSISTSLEEKKPLSLFLPDGLVDHSPGTNPDFDLIDHHLRKFDRQTTTANHPNSSSLHRLPLRKLRPIADESPIEESLLQKIQRVEVTEENTSCSASFVTPVVPKRFLSGTIFLDSFSNDDFVLYDTLVAQILLLTPTE